MGKVFVFFGTGFEEIEALTVVDLLRREKIETEMISVMQERTVTGSHEIPVITDKLLSETDFAEADMLVLPGGLRGTQELEACEALMKEVDAFAREKKPIAAICAAPSILGHRGILNGKKAIAYPGFESHLTGAEIVSEPAVRDGNLITGRGMGCAVDFALAIVEYLKGKEAKEALAEKIVFQQT